MGHHHTGDEARSVVEYSQHFVIEPSFPWWGGAHRSDGKPVAPGFQYSSDVAQQLSVEEVRALLDRLGMLA